MAGVEGYEKKGALAGAMVGLREAGGRGVSPGTRMCARGEAGAGNPSESRSRVCATDRRACVIGSWADAAWGLSGPTGGMGSSRRVTQQEK